MASPEPVDVIDTTDLAGDAAFESFEPTLLEFANGVRVVINPSSIVEGYLQFDGRSAGGLGAVADADLADAVVAGDIVYDSGVADIDPVVFDAFVADREIDLYASVNAFTEDLTGYAAIKDMESLFQYVHLLMTDPRVDAVASRTTSPGPCRWPRTRHPIPTTPGLRPSSTPATTTLASSSSRPSSSPPSTPTGSSG